MSVLIQACCGPCSLAIDGKYFFNGDNFDSKREYDKRLCAMLAVSDGTVVEQYNPRVFKDCGECIKYRLARCAQYARENGFDAFTTTLTVSPHKDTTMVNNIGQIVAAEQGITFIEHNLKKSDGFKHTVNRSKELWLYRQNYCGCARSMRQ